MRTTVTLDPDVEALLKREMRDRGVSFKVALNSGLRAALTRPATTTYFQQQTFSLGSVQHFRPEKALSAADAIEDLEFTRKPMFGK